jgi:ribose 5-phosphate isomerase B
MEFGERMRIAIAADHNGFELKNRLVSWLISNGHDVADCTLGHSLHPDYLVDYPHLCLRACSLITSGDADAAVIIGASGLGESIICNKIPGIRAGLGHDDFMVEISRGHNDANVLVLGTKVISDEEAERLLAKWLVVQFKGGVHQQWIEVIAQLEAVTRLHFPSVAQGTRDPWNRFDSNALEVVPISESWRKVRRLLP